MTLQTNLVRSVTALTRPGPTHAAQAANPDTADSLTVMRDRDWFHLCMRLRDLDRTVEPTTAIGAVPAAIAELDRQIRSFIAEDMRYCDDVESLCVLADSHDSQTRPRFVTWPLSKIT
jgi:hypothetical protein